MNSDQSFARVKDTFEQWAMYEMIVARNHMLHAELADALARWAVEFDRPMSVLDLGCGDAWLPVHAFQDSEVAQYVGFDLSESAVDRARKLLEVWSGRTEVMLGNLIELIAKVPDASKNLVLASYSLHHFVNPQKQEVLSHCARVLQPDGTLVWIDSVMRDGESREAYLQREGDEIMQWSGLSDAQRQKIVEHIWEADFPESATWMNNATAQAGFAPGTLLLEDEHFAAWAFRKP